MDRNLNPPPPDLPLLHHLKLNHLQQRLVKFKSGKMAAAATVGAAAAAPGAGLNFQRKRERLSRAAKC